jgi:hypothetical protein
LIRRHRIILNLAGEGEVADAIDINSLVFPFRSPDQWARPGRFIRGDLRALPVRANAATEVIGRRLPMMSGSDRSVAVREAVRVLRPGGVLRLHSSSGGATVWLPIFEVERLTGSKIEGIYATGVKQL